MMREGRDGVVGWVVVSETEIPGSSPTAANFFFVFLPKSSAFAEENFVLKIRSFFLAQKAPHFLKKSLHKLQIR